MPLKLLRAASEAQRLPALSEKGFVCLTAVPGGGGIPPENPADSASGMWEAPARAESQAEPGIAGEQHNPTSAYSGRSPILFNAAPPPPP